MEIVVILYCDMTRNTSKINESYKQFELQNLTIKNRILSISTPL